MSEREREREIEIKRERKREWETITEKYRNTWGIRLEDRGEFLNGTGVGGWVWVCVGEYDG